MHPSTSPATPGLNPGVRVTLDVLLPGEETAPIRHNSTQVNFCIRGSGRTIVGGKQIPFGQYDVWNHPSYLPYRHLNDGKEITLNVTVGEPIFSAFAVMSAVVVGCVSE